MRLCRIAQINKLSGLSGTFLLLILCLTLTGCDRTQIEDRDFVLAAGITYEDNMFGMSLARPDLSALTGQRAGKEEKPVVTYRGYNISEIEKMYAMNSENKLDFGHLKAIILDYKLASNPDKMKEFLMYIQNDYQISRNTLVFYTEKTQEEILNLDENVSGSLGEYLEKIYENNSKNIYEKKVTIEDLIRSSYESDNVIIIPQIIILDKMPALSGAGIFRGSVINEKLTESELEFTNLAKGNGKHFIITLENDNVLGLKNIKGEYYYTITDGKPYVLIDVTGNGDIIQNVSGEPMQILEEESNDFVKNKIVENLNTLMKDKDIDFLNLYGRSSYKNKKIWIRYKDKQKKFIEDLSVGVTVKLVLR